MFWHTAAALGQPYWLLPVPHAYWMQEEMQVGGPGSTRGAHSCLLRPSAYFLVWV
jgi:hypothetical protein